MKYLVISSAILASSVPSMARAAIALTTKAPPTTNLAPSAPPTNNLPPLAPPTTGATIVYPGCAVPSLKAGHHTFYIDPVNGSMNGDGSAAKPWHTLAEVVDTSNKLLSTTSHNPATWKQGDQSYIPVNPTGPIKPGDVLMLKTGNHGDVVFRNSTNTDFITVMPAPGQSPVITSINFIASSKWLLQGLKVVGAHPKPGGVTATVYLGGTADWMGSSENNIFENGEVEAAEDTSGWSFTDWNTKPDNYAIMTAGHCDAVNGNHLHNIINGLGFGGSESVFENNLLTEMSNDGVDFYGSNQIISHNTIKGGVNHFATEILHPDGIQGWSLTDASGNVIVNKNDLIDGNTILKTGDGSVTQMQGITVFDGLWDGLTISNNVVVSNVYQGIAMVGGTNVTIINNTVIASDPDHYGTWITAGMGCCSASVPKPVNVVVRNNITNSLLIQDPAVISDHNVIATRLVTRRPDLTWNYMVQPGSEGTNRVNPAVLQQFVIADIASGQYDLRLRPNSIAIGAGSPAAAPLYDIVNRKRSTPFDAGAYQH